MDKSSSAKWILYSDVVKGEPSPTGRGRRSRDEKGNQGVGDILFTNILHLFSIYFFFFNYFTQEPLLYHLFCILFLPTPTTHDPRHLATLIIWSLMGIRKSLSVECCLETKMRLDVKLLCDVMAHTIGYIQVKMRAASFRLARTHTRFTHWRESNSLGAPRLASRGTNSDLLE